MKYRKSLTDVKRALAKDNSTSSVPVSSDSPGVKLKRAMERLDKVTSR